MLTRPMNTADQNAPMTSQSQGDIGGFAWADEGRSGERTCLQQKSLLTGNITGKYARDERLATESRNPCAAATSTRIP